MGKTSFKPTVRECKIAIVGLGCYYPGAGSPLQLWENILARRQQFREMPDCRLPNAEYYDPDPSVPNKTYQNKAAVIEGYEFNWAEKRIPKQTYDSTDIVHWLALDTALQAIADAHYNKDNIPREKTGVILGNTLTGEFTRSNQMLLRWPYVRKALRASARQKGLSHFADEIESTMEEYYKSIFAGVTEDTLAGGLANTIAGRVCNFLDLHGGGYIVDGACSSSLLAVITAANYLELGQMDIAIAGGVDVSLDTFELVGFAKTKALTPDEMRVYDKSGKGFLPGEGCGMIVMKRLEDAVLDKDQIYAIINGWGISSDGKGGITAPSAAGQSRALIRAHQKGNFNPLKLDFIEGHGTGTTVGDKVELEAISIAINRNETIPERSCGVTSFKSIVGHTKAAAGIGALIKTAIAVNRRILPPTAGLKDPNPIFNDKAVSLYPLTRGEIRDHKSTLFAGVSAMGFGGINSHVLIQSADAPSRNLQPAMSESKLMVSNQSHELYIFSSATREDLIELLEKFKRDALGISYGEMADLAYRQNTETNFSVPLRASIIAESPTDLLRKLNLLTGKIKDWKDNNQISLENYSVVAGYKKDNLSIGAIFPGQGSQKLNMTRKLTERHDWLKEMLNHAQDVFSDDGTDEVISSIFKPTYKTLNDEKILAWQNDLKQTGIAQPAITLASLLWYEYLIKLGIKIHCVSGHSLGELMAFYAAGLLNKETLLKFAAFRGKSMAENGSGTMASLLCSADAAEQFLKEINGYAVVANINCSQQTVVSGDAESIQQIIQLAQNNQVGAKELPVSAAFHSQLVSPVGKAISQYAPLMQKESAKSDVMLISSVDGQIVGEDVDKNAYFAFQALNKVNFIRAVETLAEHCDMLLEIGPGKILSGLVSGITDAVRSFPVEINSDDDYSLNVLLGNSFMMGSDINTEELYKNRLIREFIPAYEKKFLVNPLERPFPDNLKQDDGKQISLPDPLSGIHSSEPGFVNYLKARSNFIREVIDADFKYFTSSGKINTVEVGNDKTVDLQKKVIAEPTPQKTGLDVRAMVYNKIASLTGFATEGFKDDMKLLDDFNLDSIKSGALINGLAKSLNAAGKLNASALSNASLNDIIAALEKLSENQENKEATLTEPLQPAIENQLVTDHVNAYSVKLTEEPLKLNYPAITEYWNNKSMVLIHCEDDEKHASELILELKTHIPKIVNATDKNLALLNSFENSCLLVLIPNDRMNASTIGNVVSLLTVVTANLSDTNMLGFVQFNDGMFSKGTGEAMSGEARFSVISFAASLHHERPDMKIRVIETEKSATNKDIAEMILSEFITSLSFDTTGYDGNHARRKMKYLPVHAIYEDRVDITLNEKDVVIASGGAKGITAECVFAMAKKYRCKTALIGSSPVQEEITATLDRYKKENLEVQYYSCNIADVVAVKKITEKVKLDLGNISVVIHGAGKNIPRRAEKVSYAEAMHEISPKLLGVMNMCEALNGHSLKYFVALTSIIGITGMPGNSWYAFSNESLDLYLRERGRKQQFRTRTIAYSIWNEVGMGARMGSNKVLADMGIGSISPSLGVEQFLLWIERDHVDQQVVVSSTMGGLDTWSVLNTGLPATGRFVSDITLIKPGMEMRTRVKLSRLTDLYLDDHNYNGSLLFPTVFGLEAMAQAACMVSGIAKPERLTFENISLLNPIVVPDNGETEIEIKATVMQDSGKTSGEVRIFTGISTEISGFSTFHFSAEILMNTEDKPAVKDHGKYNNESLGISPVSDLYTWLLFQGPRFQHISKVFDLTVDRVEFVTDASEDEPSAVCFSPQVRKSFLMGNPLFRDTLLQSVQLFLTSKKYLPIAIKRWELFNIATPVAGGRVISRLKALDHDKGICDVELIVNDELTERIEGYTVKALEPTPEYPDARFIAGLPAIYENAIDKELTKYRSLLSEPLIYGICKHDEEFNKIEKEERHAIEDFVFMTMSKSSPEYSALSENRIARAANGKPFIVDSEINISIADSRSVLLMTLGRHEQGCDIEFIEHKSREAWNELLDYKFGDVLEQLHGIDNNIDISATRIWCVRESLIKSLGMVPLGLGIAKVLGEGIIFKVRNGGNNLMILTFPVKVLPGNTLIISSLVTIKEEEKPAPYQETKGSVYSTGFDKVSGSFSNSFLTTFKDCRNFFGKTHFTIYPEWMGNLREMVLTPIADELLKDLGSGKFGMVTNESEIHVFQEAETLTPITGNLWITGKSDLENSFIDLHVDFRKTNPATGALVKLADCSLSTTWVKIESRGIVKKSPIPEYFLNFLKQYMQKSAVSDTLTNSEYPGTRNLGATVYESLHTIRPSIRVFVKEFQTGLSNGNTVGNLYYSNYYSWQSNILEQYFYQMAPEIMLEGGKNGEFLTLESNVKHLQEAMPFETIMVELYIEKIYENGLKCYVEYFSKDGQEKRKLAYGSNTLIWCKRVSETSWPVASALPEKILQDMKTLTLV